MTLCCPCCPAATADLSFGSPDAAGSLEGAQRDGRGYADLQQPGSSQDLQGAAANVTGTSVQESELQFGSPDPEASGTLDPAPTFSPAGQLSASASAPSEQQQQQSGHGQPLDFLQRGSGSARRQSSSLADAARSIAAVYRSSLGKRQPSDAAGAAVPHSAPIAVPGGQGSGSVQLPAPSPFEAAAPADPFIAALQDAAQQDEAGALPEATPPEAPKEGESA